MNPSIRSAFALALALSSLAACGPETSNPTPTSDAAPDDTAADVAVDVAVDARPDAAPDASTVDVTVDVSVDRPTSDVAADISVDRPAADVPVMDAPVIDTPAVDVAPVDVPRVDVAPVDTQPPIDTPAGRTCGGRGTPPCETGFYCNFPPSSICGAADGPGTCDPVPSICTRELNPVCGCDGTTYSNPCMAAAASVSVRSPGACASTDAGGPDATSSCAAQDARGVGVCDLFLGYAWNGSTCVGLSGCSCTGAACRSLFTSIEACRAAYPSCDCRTVGCSGSASCMACRGVGGIVYACIPAGAAC